MSLSDRLRAAFGRNAPGHTSASATGLDPEPPSDDRGYTIAFDDEGANFVIEPELLTAFDRDVRGARAISLGAFQHAALRMLEEQGDAERLPNGFLVTAADAVRLDPEIREFLGLPPRFAGTFSWTSEANTTSTRFRVLVTVVKAPGAVAEPFERVGPIIRIRNEEFLLSPPALDALEAWEAHSAVPASSRDRNTNVELLARLQSAGTRAADPESGIDHDPALNVSLPVLEKYTTRTVDTVGLVVDEQPDGSLSLSPDLGVPVDGDAVWKREHQLDGDNRVIAIDNQLLLLSEKAKRGVKEISRKRRVSKTDAKNFWKAPAETISPDLVDIEASLGLRVEGLEVIVPVTFNELERESLGWLDEVDAILQPAALSDLIEDDEDLADAREKVASAKKRNESHITFKENVVDVSDDEAVDAAFGKAEQKVFREPDSEEDADAPVEDVSVGMLIKESEDEHLTIAELVERASFDQDIDLSGVKKTPFPHQDAGIRWIVGLMAESLKGDLADADRLQGGILADDMGLGKTFMTLVALRTFAQLQRATGAEPLPVLAVLPLSLIENWEQEIRETFEESPFTDIVVLQSARDLSRFRMKGAGRETKVAVTAVNEEGRVKDEALKLSLTVGDAFAEEERLDRPGRLVLTTYQGLASYQLSLGSVDWGAVVFDEAQTLKNPETLVSRAAKGLKARFKLLATGTPVENGLMDIWNLLDTAQPGLFGAWPDFRKRWVARKGASDDEIDELGRGLRLAIGKYMLRRTKDGSLSGLPSKTHHTGIAEPAEGYVHDPVMAQVMPDVQRVAYDKVLDSYVPGKGKALPVIQGLRSISLHPSLHTTGPKHFTLDDSARMRAVDLILEQVKTAGEKAIVFVIDKKMQVQLSVHLGEKFGLPVRIVNGDTKATGGKESQTRRGIIREFEAKDGFNVIVMSPIAVGTGVTVVGANHAIHLERHWNPAKEAQATDRIYRIGQKRPVHVYFPIAVHPTKTSFDHHLDRLLQFKTTLKDAVVVPEVQESELANRMSLQ